VVVIERDRRAARKPRFFHGSAPERPACPPGHRV